MKNQSDNDSLAADADYSGSAFQADAVMAPSTNSLVGVPGAGNDDVLSPSSQTDYRSVDEGLTSVGATDSNADMASLGGLGTPGVRVGDDVPGLQTGGVNGQGADVLGGDDRDQTIGGDVLNDPAQSGESLGTSAMDVNTMNSGNRSF